MQPNYLDSIFRISEPYLSRSLSPTDLDELKRVCYAQATSDRQTTIDRFLDTYYRFTKRMYQRSYDGADLALNQEISSNIDRPKLLWGDCLSFLRRMDSESVHLMITSPPYYNAREYSQWNSLDNYLDDMSTIISECYRVIDNHRVFVFNVGDIFDNDFRHTKSSWVKRRIPLGAYFTQIFESAGFQFVDDFIWDKGEPQSQRHKNGENPYPLYQYPINCYEHIFVFYKHRLDPTIYPCPVCGCLKVNGNAYSGVGVKSWECKNLECTGRSQANRGKRFSARSYVMSELKKEDNRVDEHLLQMWRRDIVKLKPVFKINAKGQNTIGHSAPFPQEIPKYAIQMFGGIDETVLDPFAGSFTTTSEALLQQRNALGMELNKSLYRAVALRRFSFDQPIEVESSKTNETPLTTIQSVRVVAQDN